MSGSARIFQEIKLVSRFLFYTIGFSNIGFVESIFLKILKPKRRQTGPFHQRSELSNTVFVCPFFWRIFNATENLRMY
ncbi:hypothetical protein A0128_15225 [Leptospira tipperaryensis]|uniref:Uncharacterized protein n=1 Tax=Leptospira tipperaryensis TaxID=2564040 RepID=A0A1D7UZR2_9LEPT|nr:hypothetical protein A0128_15225 [Leptospira tipperaryensis]